MIALFTTIIIVNYYASFLLLLLSCSVVQQSEFHLTYSMATLPPQQKNVGHLDFLSGNIMKPRPSRPTQKVFQSILVALEFKDLYYS